MIFLFDTNIILIYLRNMSLIDEIEALFNPFGNDNKVIISIVTLGELKSISLNNLWGDSKIRRLSELVKRFIVADINSENVLNRYAEIEAFSQGRLESKKLKMSARNMGKNDVWIAATASVSGATLLTTDNDFNHLHDEFLTVAKINITN